MFKNSDRFSCKNFEKKIQDVRFNTLLLKRKDFSKDVKGSKFPTAITVLNAFQIIFEFEEKWVFSPVLYDA